jgi:hypothetical protein
MRLRASWHGRDARSMLHLQQRIRNEKIPEAMSGNIDEATRVSPNATPKSYRGEQPRVRRFVESLWLRSDDEYQLVRNHSAFGARRFHVQNTSDFGSLGLLYRVYDCVLDVSQETTTRPP